MSIPYIRKYYNLPNVKRGAEIKYKGKVGKITSGHMGWLRVRFYGETFIRSIHPTDENLEILSDNKIYE